MRESGQTGLRGRLDAPSTAGTCPGHAGVGRHVDDHRRRPRAEAPLTLAEPAPPALGLRETFGLWANLGISLLLPVAAVVRRAGRPAARRDACSPSRSARSSARCCSGSPPRPPPASGSRRWCCCAGCSAAGPARCRPGSTSCSASAGRPSRSSSSPRRRRGRSTRRAGRSSSAAGVLATAMALRPLGVVRVLSRYAVWAALAAVVYLFVRVLAEPLPQVAGGRRRRRSGRPSTSSSRCRSAGSRSPPTTRGTSATRGRPSSARPPATALATFVMFTLGVLALSAYGTGRARRHRRAARRPVRPARRARAGRGRGRRGVRQHLLDRRLDAEPRRPASTGGCMAVAVGTVATLLALSLDVVAYEPFLFLLGAVFVPLAGVLLVAYYLLPRGAWDVSDDAPARPALLLPWAVGFVAYQLTVPTYFIGTGRRLDRRGGPRARPTSASRPTHGLSASLVSLTVASLLTVAVALPGALRARRAARDPTTRSWAGCTSLTDTRDGRDAARRRAPRRCRPARRSCRCGPRTAPTASCSTSPSGSRALCDDAGALCLVDDRVDVALAVGAGGTHLGAHDLPLAAARRVAGPGHVLGGTARDPRLARELVAAGRRLPRRRPGRRHVAPRTACPTRSASPRSAPWPPPSTCRSSPSAASPSPPSPTLLAAGVARRRRRRRGVRGRRPGRGDPGPAARAGAGAHDATSSSPAAGVAGLSVAWRAAQRGPVGHRRRRRARHGRVVRRRRHARPGRRGGVRRGARSSRSAAASLELYPAFVAELEQASGTDVGLRTAGTLLVGFDEDDVRGARRTARLPPRARAVRRPADAAGLPRAGAGADPAAARRASRVGGDHSVEPRALHAALLARRRARRRRGGARAGSTRCSSRTAGPPALRARRRAPAAPRRRPCWRSAPGAAGCRACPPGTCRCGRSRARSCGCAGEALLDGTVRALVRGRAVYLVPYGADRRRRRRDRRGAGLRRAGSPPAPCSTCCATPPRCVPGLTELELVETLARWRPGTPDNAPAARAVARCPGWCSPPATTATASCWPRSPADVVAERAGRRRAADARRPADRFAGDRFAAPDRTGGPHEPRPSTATRPSSPTAPTVAALVADRAARAPPGRRGGQRRRRAAQRLGGHGAARRRRRRGARGRGRWLTCRSAVPRRARAEVEEAADPFRLAGAGVHLPAAARHRRRAEPRRPAAGDRRVRHADRHRRAAPGRPDLERLAARRRRARPGCGCCPTPPAA